MHRNFLLRRIAAFLAVTILLEILAPSVACALTTGPTQPEVFGHQPVDANTNVSPVTGGFNYTIPITSVPEYPMAIGYNGQADMNQEAGMFGYGINGFTGAIARSTVGLPDDIRGGSKHYLYENQKRWMASVTGTFTPATMPLPSGELGLQANLNVSLTAGYDNYKGVFAALGAGIGLGAKIKPLEKIVPTTAGVGLRVDSDYGWSGSVGLQTKYISYTVFSPIKDPKLHHGVSLNLRAGDLDSKSKNADAQLPGFSLSSLVSGLADNNITDYGSADLGASSLVSDLPSVMASSKTFGVSLAVPITPNITVGGSFFYSDFGNKDERKEAYGLMHLDGYDRRNVGHQADFGVEGENFYENKDFNNPTYLQRDNFIINSQGFSGSMQLFHGEYGVVSRNYARTQTRRLDLIGLHTERKEVDRWTHASRASVNKSMDILALLKKGDREDSKDFDNTIFVENELKSLTEVHQKHNAKASFKIKGDLAGEFKVAPGKSTDFAPNLYELKHLSGTGGNAKFAFLREEKDMPLYYPEAKAKYKENAIAEKATNIEHYTVAQVLSTLSQWSAYDPATDADPVRAAKFKSSFYTHTANKANTPTLNKATNVVLGPENTESFNILQHLAKLRDEAGASSYFNDLIADVRVKTPEGLTYVYNLPVFNHSATSTSLAGKGVNAPVVSGNGYKSFGDKDRNKVTVNDEFKHPYAWLLTAVVGSDYIDFDDVPGPSEGDLGYWVKFKYVKAADHYRWRFPFGGMYHSPGATHVLEDDSYMASSGEKEIYYIDEIETAGYISKYTYQKRFDGVEAAGGGIANGAAYNTLSQKKPASGDLTGYDYQYAVSRVALYRKFSNAGGNATDTYNSVFQLAANGVAGKLIKATDFKYDYSICPKTPNNLVQNGHVIAVGNVPYHVGYGDPAKVNQSIESGKLTLRKVQHISYEAGAEGVYLPSYEFEYGFDGKNYQDASSANYQPEFNPEYDEFQVDSWGNYSYRSKIEVVNPSITHPADGGDGSATHHYYTKYTELDPLQANRNAQAYKLSTVYMPGGGSLNVQFEANAYANVQDKTPYVMRQVRNANITQKNTNPLNEQELNILEVEIDITDLHREGLTLQKVLKQNESVYGELTFYESNSPTFPSREDQVFVSDEEAKILSIGEVQAPDDDSRVYQTVQLIAKENSHIALPYISKYKQYLFGESLKMNAIREKLKTFSNSCDQVENLLKKYESLEKDDPIDAVKKMVANVRNQFTPSAYFVASFRDCFGDAQTSVFSRQSFIRTPIYKAKYTGSRVNSLAYADNFQYATMPNGTAGEHDNVYRTNYFYDQAGNGKGTSEGVATIEPGGGKSAVIDLYDLPGKGAGFYPSPAIMSAKTTIETSYASLDGAAGQAVSRHKGKVAYHFFTPKDQQLLFEKNLQKSKVVNAPGPPKGHFFLMGLMTYLIIKFKVFGKRFTVKIPVPVPLKVNWRRHDQYYLKSFAYTDVTDMYGKVKEVVQYAADGQPVQRDKMTYFSKSELVPGYNGISNPEAFANTPEMLKPGLIEQSWSEAYQTDESKIELIPWLLLLHANTSRKFAYTNMKYSYVPSVLKEVSSTNYKTNASSTISYTGFDYFTGKPIETRYKSSDNTVKIARVEPAYWRYPQMGPVSKNSTNLNMLTAAAANYMYLNQPTVQNLVSAGITEWSKDKVQFADSWASAGKQFASGTEFLYQYQQLSGAQVEMLYNVNGQSRTSLPESLKSKVSDVHVKSAQTLFLPYKSHVYETALNDNGTYQQYQHFNFAAAAQATSSGWKLVTTNTLFGLNGQVLENKDLLDKYVVAKYGYNSRWPVASVANASYKAAAVADAENLYRTTAGALLLDDANVSLVDARVVEACQPQFADKQLTYATLASSARVLNVCIAATGQRNQPFAKLNVGYRNTKGAMLKRTLWVRYNENGDFKILSSQGEPFSGFFTIKGAEGGSCNNVRLAFDPAVFTEFSLDNSFTTAGYTISAATEALDNCTVTDFAYQLPDADCIGQAHTGRRAFRLDAEKQGTQFVVTPAQLPLGEQGRSYKAMVWVHSSSHPQTALVVTNQSGQELAKATLASPYVRAGEWSLLRLDVAPGTATQLQFFVANPSAAAGPAIYDDFRVLPEQAAMEHSVYDNFTGRVVASLNNDNFATLYRYDGEGRLLEVVTEVENTGQQTVKRYRYNQQKKN